jgi:hypothetical protein
VKRHGQVWGIYIIKKDEISWLESLAKLVNAKLSEKPELDNKLSLKKKFKGSLGEVIGLIELYRHLGDSCTYEWFGGRKKDFDLIVRNNQAEIKIQIKASFEDEYSFQIPTKGYRPEDIEEIKNKNFTNFLKTLNKNIDKKNVDFWLFIHVKSGGNTFYILDKKSLNRILEEDYRRYLNKPKNKITGYGIKDGIARFFLKEKNVSDLLEQYEGKWDLITARMK